MEGRPKTTSMTKHTSQSCPVDTVVERAGLHEELMSKIMIHVDIAKN